MKMRALIKRHPREGIWMEEVDRPVLQDNEVLVRIRKTAICGTDIHIYKWDNWAAKTVPIPMVIGHEFVGEVVEVGHCVTHVRVGDRVSGEGHITCGRCACCQKGDKHLCLHVLGIGYDCPGCFSDFFALPGENVFSVPKEISDDLAAIFDPFGNATHTALSFPLVGEDVLITGAGPIGIMAVAICRFAGARHVVITDPNPYRLELARSLGASAIVNITQEKVKTSMERLGIEHGFTVGFEMSGNPQALNTLLETARNGAKIGLLGLLPPETQIDWDLVIFKMLELKGVYGREVFGTWHKMTNMLQGGLDITPVITHRFPVEEYEKAFATMLERQSGKVILDW